MWNLLIEVNVSVFSVQQRYMFISLPEREQWSHQWSSTLSGLTGSAVVTGKCIGNQSGTFINMEWRTFEGGSIQNQDWHWPGSLAAWLLSSAHHRPSSIAKGTRGQNVCELISESLTCGGTGARPKTQHPSPYCLCNQLSIMVRSELSRFPLKHVASLDVWSLCGSSENPLVFCLT